MKYIFREIERKPGFKGILILYGGLFFFLLFLINAGMTGFHMLYVLSRYIFYLDAAIMLLLFLMASSSYNCDIDEAISACRKPGFYQQIFLKIFLMVFFVFQMTIGGALILTSILQDGTDYFFGYAAKSYVMNILLPMFICIMLAYFLSLWKKRNEAAVLLVGFLFLVSPMLSSLEWKAEPIWPIDKLWSGILHPFRIFYENGSWAANPQLGLQTDPERIWLFIFWVTFIACCALLVRIKKISIRRIIVGILAPFMVFSMAMSYLPSGAYHIDGNWDGVMQDYYTYDTPVQITDQSSSCGYRVTNYKMELSFNRFLDADCEMAIEADLPLNQFIFTLYHGYEISGIRSESTGISWEQKGDCVLISTEQPLSELKLTISYRGSHKVFYSYSEGAMLPGWFPWYPMTGERQIIRNYITVPSGYNTFNRIPPADISLHVNGGFQIVTNLTAYDGDIYAGTSDSITLIGGEICLTENSAVKDYLPLELTVTPEEFESSMLEQWNRVYNALLSYGIEPPAASDCKIIVTSRDLCRNYYNNDVAIFGDYILTWSYGLDIQNVSQQMILASNPTSELANVICSMGGLYETPGETLQRWKWILPDSQNEMGARLLTTISDAERSGNGEKMVIQLVQALCNGPMKETDAQLLERICD